MFVILHDLVDNDYAQIEVIDDVIVNVLTFNHRNEVWGSLPEALSSVSSKPPLGWDSFSDLDPDGYRIVATSDQLITASTHPELLI